MQLRALVTYLNSLPNLVYYINRIGLKERWIDRNIVKESGLDNSTSEVDFSSEDRDSVRARSDKRSLRTQTFKDQGGLGDDQMCMKSRNYEDNWIQQLVYAIVNKVLNDNMPSSESLVSDETKVDNLFNKETITKLSLEEHKKDTSLVTKLINSVNCLIKIGW